MENNIPTSGQRIPTKLLVGGLVLSVSVAIFPVGLVVLPAFWAYAMFRTRPAILAVFFGAFTAAAFVLFIADPLLALCLAAIAGVGAIVLYEMQRRRMDTAMTAGAIAGVAIVAMYLAICLPGILSGAGAFAEVQAEADILAKGLEQMLEASTVQMAEEMRETYEAYFAALPEAVSMAVVPAICLSGMLIGIGNVLFFRLFARKYRFGLVPLRPFRLWSIPRELTIGLCIMLIGAAILNFAELDYAQSVSTTVNILVGLPMTVQGLCCMDYLIWRKGGNVRRRRIYIFIGVAAFFYLMQVGLMLVGCIDQVFRFRERAEGRIPPSAPRGL